MTLSLIAAALVVVPMFHSEITRNAELIVTGTATHATSRWEGATIRTYVHFGRLEVHRGVVSETTLSLRFDGGQVGSDRIVVSDLVLPRVGARYLLYVAGNGRHVSPIVGVHQGMFEVVERGGREVLLNAKGLELAGIVDDRYVFVGRRDAARPQAPMPQVASIDCSLVTARPDAARLERELVARHAMPARVIELPPQRPAVADAGSDRVASPPPVTGATVPRPDAAPRWIPAREDDGRRLSRRALLAGANRAAQGR